MKLPKRNKISRNKYINLKPVEQLGGLKPNCFWYSCYDDWYNWIKNEGMTTWLHKYIHKINLNKGVLTDIKHKNEDKLLVINNIKDFDMFNKKYGFGSTKSRHIDWKKVVKDYGGIEICPFLTKRSNYLWYSAWDVASGCIWNVKAIIKNTELIYEKYKNKYHKITT